MYYLGKVCQNAQEFCCCMGNQTEVGDGSYLLEGATEFKSFLSSNYFPISEYPGGSHL